jgi:hypothetical protein
MEWAMGSKQEVREFKEGKRRNGIGAGMSWSWFEQEVFEQEVKERKRCEGIGSGMS